MSGFQELSAQADATARQSGTAVVKASAWIYMFAHAAGQLAALGASREELVGLLDQALGGIEQIKNLAQAEPAP